MARRSRWHGSPTVVFARAASAALRRRTRAGRGVRQAGGAGRAGGARAGHGWSEQCYSESDVLVAAGTATRQSIASITVGLMSPNHIAANRDIRYVAVPTGTF